MMLLLFGLILFADVDVVAIVPDVVASGVYTVAAKSNVIDD
jgi:hypothetical protein